jgi:hypothetical protein
MAEMIQGMISGNRKAGLAMRSAQQKRASDDQDHEASLPGVVQQIGSKV